MTSEFTEVNLSSEGVTTLQSLFQARKQMAAHSRYTIAGRMQSDAHQEQSQGRYRALHFMRSSWKDPGLCPSSQYWKSYRKQAYNEPGTCHKLLGSSNLTQNHNTASVIIIQRERWITVKAGKVKAAD